MNPTGAHLGLNPEPCSLGKGFRVQDFSAAGQGAPRLFRQRNPQWRGLYLEAALRQIPRLLGAIDRNPYRATYGCFDREYWHYRTADFAGEMHQEGVLPLALVYATPLPGNRWFGEARLGELAVAALEFSAHNGHRDGSCDDYYPFERALGAAVFSLAAATRAYQLLALDAPRIVAGLQRRARWVAAHDESGRLANHQALAALGLFRMFQITGRAEYRNAADDRLRRVLAWQSPEGWFDEYGGADPGYQTVTIDCLAQLRRLTGETMLDEPLRRAVAFARQFLHPDDSYGGEYGSRGTYHFYPHGFELLAPDDAAAGELADGFLRSLATGTHASFDDDRMYVHRLASLIDAWLDWSPETAEARVQGSEFRQEEPRIQDSGFRIHLPEAGLLVRRAGGTHTVVSTARGGVFKHFAAGSRPETDSGLIVETTDGRIAVSQRHDRRRAAVLETTADAERLSVSGGLDWVRFETAAPVKLAVFHLGMWCVGRCCRGLVRRLLQRRLITGRRACPIRLTRSFEFGACLRVVDRIELTDDAVRIGRMSYSTDAQAAYVAASDVYQASILRAWTDLAEYVGELNQRRKLEITRCYSPDGKVCLTTDEF